MWFGTRAHMVEVTDPQINPDYDSVAWGEATQYLNGGLGVSSSVAAHQEFYLSWGMMSRADVRKVTDFADGVYGTGLIYWLDPVAADQNVLPQQWATPSIGAYDGVPLAGDARPSVTVNSDMSQGYPAELAVYTISDTSTLRSVFVPIPPGYSGWVGVHGAPDAQGFVKVTPYAGATPAGAAVNPIILSTATTTLVNTEISGGSVTGLELSLDNSSLGVGESASFTLAGMVVQVLPTGIVPATGGFVSGQGHSGCRFMGRPTRVPYDVGSLDLVAMTAKLGEVGEWV